MIEKIILGIETSCDETSVAIFKNNKIIDEITVSSMKKQAIFGGVVPELASREHLNNLHKITSEILNRNTLSIQQITDIAYTNKPGLPVCLNVGECFAKTLSNLLNVNLMPINHLFGHLFSPFINVDVDVQFPILGLVVSGGNTIIYLAKNYHSIEILNETMDDAIGEVYDKVARKLGLEYPGGPKIDKLFDENMCHIEFMKNNLPAMAKFSYSGIKTAVINKINEYKLKKLPIDIVSFASSFQKLIIGDLIRKVKFNIEKNNCKTLAVGGGVAANNYLKKEIGKLKIENKFICDLKYTSDQASMIAWYASKIIK